MDFRKLDVWKYSMDLVEDIYRVSRTFPKEEMFGLTNQMRRAAVSVPANIAEGNGRLQAKEYARFLRISLGSLLELITYVDLSLRLELIDSDTHRRLSECCTVVNKMLSSLIKAVTK